MLFRSHLAATPLLKGLPDFRPLRIAMLRAEKMDELMAILDKIVDIYGNGSVIENIQE